MNNGLLWFFSIEYKGLFMANLQEVYSDKKFKNPAGSGALSGLSFLIRNLLPALG